MQCGSGYTQRVRSANDLGVEGGAVSLYDWVRDYTLEQYRTTHCIANLTLLKICQ